MPSRRKRRDWRVPARNSCFAAATSLRTACSKPSCRSHIRKFAPGIVFRQAYRTEDLVRQSTLDADAKAKVYELGMLWASVFSFLAINRNRNCALQSPPHDWSGAAASRLPDTPRMNACSFRFRAIDVATTHAFRLRFMAWARADSPELVIARTCPIAMRFAAIGPSAIASRLFSVERVRFQSRERLSQEQVASTNVTVSLRALLKPRPMQFAGEIATAFQTGRPRAPTAQSPR